MATDNQNSEMNHKKTYYGSYRGLKKSKIFIKEVVRFLMILENNYGELVSKKVLKIEFGENYDRIIKYLCEEREIKDKLIIEDDYGWRINNRNFDKIQELISRSVSEDAVYGQKLSSERQLEFNRYLLLATVTLALVGFYQSYSSLLERLGWQDLDETVSVVISIIIIILVLRLTYSLFKDAIF